MTREDLLHLREKKPDKEERVDAADIGPFSEKAKDEYLRRIRNPYYFKCGEIAVNVQFSENGRTVRDVLAFCLNAGKSES